MLGNALTWAWSRRARDFITGFEKADGCFLSPDALRAEMTAKWGYCNHALIAMQTELAGLSVPSRIDGTPCTLGVREISSPDDYHPMDQVFEEFYHERANTQFAYSIGHEGTIFFEDVPHAANVQVFLEREAALRNPYMRPGAHYNSILLTGTSSSRSVDQLVLVCHYYATQLGMKAVKGATDHLGGVWEGDGCFGSVTRGISTHDTFIHFTSTQNHVLDIICQELLEAGLRLVR